MPETVVFPEVLKSKCPNCSAKMDTDLPYCGACGFGLPRFPRSRAAVCTSTAIFLFIGIPAGLCSAYCFTYGLLGEWTDFFPAAILAVLCLLSARLMLKLSVGVRRYQPPA